MTSGDTYYLVIVLVAVGLFGLTLAYCANKAP